MQSFTFDLLLITSIKVMITGGMMLFFSFFTQGTIFQGFQVQHDQHCHYIRSTIE